uniref:Ig-like domain-containing protein n=1 Tax=Monodelphis domestica TaxID=13616 RepID=A0A5F8GQC7_MONDO
MLSTMAGPLLYLSLLTFCSGSLSQLVLTQPPSASASLGTTVRLTCTVNSQYIYSGVGWYQQRPGKVLQFILWVNSDQSVSRGSGIPERFSGSSSGAHRYLSISNIQSEDEADYYCGQGYSSYTGSP